MIAIYEKKTGEINQTLWEDKLPEWFELSSNENYTLVKGNINPHELHLCKLRLDKKGQAIEVHRPIFGNWEGKGILRRRRIIGHKKADDIKIMMKEK